MLCMMSRTTLYCPMQEEIEEIGPTNCQEISKNEVFCNEPVQEVNASKGDSLNQGNNGLVHKQEVAKESSEQDNTNDAYLPGSKDACKNKEHCEEAAVRKEKNVCENKEENGESTS